MAGLKENKFNFKDLFVLDMANNHQGSVSHGEKIITETSDVLKKNNIKNAAIKFQFRQLDSFIHPDHQTGSDHKYVTRFLSTKMDRKGYQQLFDAVKNAGLITMCTPFDEESVDVIVDMNFDLLKIASCSAKDWPLIEKAASSNLPIVFSTGGASIDDIDNLVSFFEHQGVDFAMMHCMAIYPTPDNWLQLNQIDILKKRYPGVTIGWSTHESPDDTVPVAMAYAKGARMFERHIGLETSEISLNDYSSRPSQLDSWFASYNKAISLSGGPEKIIPDEETASLDSLKRGVYVKTPLKSGDVLSENNTYFAIPYIDGQLDSGLIGKKPTINIDLPKDSAIKIEDVTIIENNELNILKKSIHEVKALLREASVVIGNDFDVEFSHHYGIEKYTEIGTVIITCINREYAKKILVQLPGQDHPEHYHKRKEETFQVLYGDLTSTLDGVSRSLEPGESVLVQPGVWHSFKSKNGCVFEEVSSTHYNDDSFYKDKNINKMKREQRKTVVKHWGRFEINDILG
ncbi:MAG: sialic acid synthase [Candidatus Marinimicrobia bacterium]|nr:sialic acid synthase [Candidatus Neomarinimicrobiota bacterium]